MFFSLSSILDKLEEKKEFVEIKTYLQYSMEVSAFIHELQKERGLSAGYVGSDGKGFKEKLQNQRIIVDEKHTKVKFFISTHDLLSKSNIDNILLNTEDLQNFRKEVDSSKVFFSAVLKFYNTAVKKSINSASNVSLISHDFKLSQLLSSYVSLIKAKEFTGIKRAVLSHAFGSDIFTAQDFSSFNTY
ncbi:MAG: nitrate- and nitrite sensing domain-containing protein, partial [Sulfurimonas sp.]|nr:nitrate- and nitrite sensing domain-containing protein [Sulfurimonas sp.]